MKLVPYVLQTRESPTLFIHTFHVFLIEGGRDIWEIGSVRSSKEVQNEFLEPNGFVSKSLQKEGDVYYAELEPTTLSSFYTWEELLDEKKREDCFRTFTFCFEKETGEAWFSSEILQTPFEKTTFTPTALFKGLKNLHKV